MQSFRRFFSFLEVAITDNFFPFFFVAYIFCLHPSNSRLPPHFHLSPLFFLFLFFLFFLIFFFFFFFLFTFLFLLVGGSILNSPLSMFLSFLFCTYTRFYFCAPSCLSFPEHISTFPSFLLFFYLSLCPTQTSCFIDTPSASQLINISNKKVNS